MESRKINVPNSWEGITLEEFLKITKLIYTDDISYYIDIINIFNDDITIEEISKWSDDTIKAISSHLSFLNTEMDIDVQKEVKIANTTFKIIDLNKITIGEYISIQTLIDNKKLSHIGSIPAILSIILRPEDEEFDVNVIDERIELFTKELSIVEAMNLAVNYNNWHSIILDAYSGLFKTKSDDDDDSSFDIGAPSMNPKWRWFSIIERLADGDITRFDEIYKQSYINCLNLLSYWKEKNDYENSMRRREEMMRKHR